MNLETEQKSRRQLGAERSWKDPDVKERRIAAIKKAWEDVSPEQKQARTDPSRQARRRARQERMDACLQGQTLRDYTERGQSAAEIAAAITQPPSTVKSWLGLEGLHTHKPTTLNKEEIERRRNLVRWGQETGVIGFLLPSDRKIIEMRYGGEKIMPLQKIAGRNMTRQAISLRDRKARDFLSGEKERTETKLPLS